VKSGAQPGNTNATKDKRLITDELRRCVTQSPEKLKAACMKVLNDAVDGNLAAFSVMADRLDGKPAQSHLHGEDSDNPFTMLGKVILHKANESNSTDD